MIKRTRGAALFAGSAMALALMPAAAFAQQGATPQPPAATPPAGEADAAQPVEEGAEAIVVTGFRASLQSAVAEKRTQNLIVESVTAEDIGRLPDNSIGEAIARLPGLTAQRLNGRANVVSIRGFGPDFSQTLLNGREQTSLGDNRAVEFDQYPGELVNQVVVYKSPSAELVGQGLVGTIDIRTIRPLDYGRRVLAIGGRGSYTDLGRLNAGSEEFGYRASATFVDQFADDTIGISLAASYVDEPYQVQEFNAWGYADVGGNAVIGGNKSFVQSTNLKRLGLAGTVQWEPTPGLTLTVDGFYSDFDDDQLRRGIELPLGFGGGFGVAFNPAGATVENGVITAGQFTNVRGVVRNDVFQRQAELVAGGFNAKWDGADGWKAYFDFGYSRTDRNELNLESYAGTGYNGDDTGIGAAATIGFRTGERGTVFSPSLNYSDPSLVLLTDPLGWGGDSVQAGYYNNRIIDDELMQYRVHVEREIDSFISAVKFGMNYTNRDKSLTPNEAFVRLPGGARTARVPSELLLAPTNLAYLGLGPIVSYDPRQLIDAGALVLQFRDGTGGGDQDVLAKQFSVREDLMTLYLQADIEQRLGGGVLTGNIGVQAVSTDQESTGFAFTPTGPQVITRGASYWDVLPSLNLSMRFDSDLVLRFAASRQIMRPRLDDMRIALGYGINNNPAESPTGQAPFISGGGGNPFLRPYRANAVDFNIEKYFGNAGVLALQLFYKDIKSFIFGGRFVFDYAGLPLPPGPAPVTTIGNLDAPVNTGGGDLYGAELAATLPFDTISSLLSGFGITGGVSYTETSVTDASGNETRIPGYSKWVANGTLFYEAFGLNARASVRHRSSFLGDFTGFGGSPTRRVARGETIVDAQIGYEFPQGTALQGLNIYVQGQNLTNEPFVSIAGEGLTRQVLDYQTFGRRFLAGFTYRF
ncbi:TonB-dependent receptor [Qipengyuania thermophila]|uniref:TonB-dependent receptor n=1 Tax=Qipengyuania thermophila TaxID=2509361 RepID=UPI0028F42E70|nr:TonB-dependent receptor [Qipengyuania thermophila]